MKENEFNLTHSKKYNVQLLGGKDTITLFHQSDGSRGDAAWFSLLNAAGVKQHDSIVQKSSTGLVYSLHSANPGRYRLQVLQQKSPQDKMYVGWLGNIGVVIGRDRKVAFEKSPVMDNNMDLYGRLKDDWKTLEAYKMLPSGNNKAIILKAYEIIQGCFTDYSKVMAIHDWIAQNIYYDMDSYLSGHIDYSKLGDSSKVFENRLAVCAGYSDLAVVMLRAIGIPAVSQSCFALGMSTSGNWTDQNIKHESNHAITRAYVQKRWILMDTTWDSHNEYKNATFQKNGQITHQYFDPTIQSLSNTHKLCG